MKITHYDLFAGIGGFSLALDTVFYDQEIKHIFCEWEAFPTAVLKKHWPDATYYGDIADLVAGTDSQRRAGERREDEVRRRQSRRTIQDEEQGLVVVTGGFPCQPFSHAGRRQGTSDDRYKWPDMFAIIRNVRPDWVIAENVRGLVTWNDGMVLETVCSDLESEGYEVQPLIIPAVTVGAPHRRDRVWIIATNTGSRRLCKQEICGEQSGRTKAIRSSEAGGGQSGKFYTTGEYIGWNNDWREVAFATCYDGVDDGLPRQMDGVTISASRHRKERLKACGNAIVPQVVMEIFTAIRSTTL